MINQCPVCDSLVSDEENKGHCRTCGWEFVTFLAPFEHGQNLLKERLETTRKYIQTLREGSDEVKKKIAELEADQKVARESLNELTEKNKRLEVEFEQAVADQNLIAANQHYKGKRTRGEYSVSDNGDILLEIEEPTVKLPTIMMVIKSGDIFVADPKFGSDGSYAAIINPKLWKVSTPTLFSIKNHQINKFFPNIAGKYTFSLYAAMPHFVFTRKGREGDILNVIINFNQNGKKKLYLSLLLL